MTDRPFIGLLIALVVEARHWTRIRWEFDDSAYLRAWQFSTISTAMVAVLIWLDGDHSMALLNLLSWLALLLFPLQFVQNYGMRDSMPLETFSFLAKRRRMRNERLGLIGDSVYFNYGNIFFLATMISAAAGSKADSWIFLPGLVLLTGWMLLGSGSSKIRSLAPVLIMAGGLALAGQIGLKKLADWIGRGGGDGEEQFNPNFNYTQIGSKGTIQQSSDIVWRIRPEALSRSPLLLRTATFNFFFGSTWQNQRMSATGFNELSSTLIGEDSYYLLREGTAVESLAGLAAFNLRGAVSDKSPLPLPGDAVGMRNIEADGIESNSLGTVRIRPKFPIIDGAVFWNGGTNPESAPQPTDDLQIPPSERDVIRSSVDRLRLRDEMDLQLKLARLRSWFHNEFRYTRDLTIQKPPIQQQKDGHKAPTALAQFLTDVQAGHCEYFATATTLMLREIGIQARYTVGYAVMENDLKRGGFVIRGTHAHAWCRLWDETTGRWIDFDPTPPDWLATVSQQPSAMQSFYDFVKRLREDSFIWRNDPSNQLAVSIIIGSVGIIFSFFIIRRLWLSKRQIHSTISSGDYHGAVVRTPLHNLEIPARKHLGPRPPGQPFAVWLARLRPSLPDAQLLDEAIALHQQLRFDPVPPPHDHRERLETLARQLEAGL